MRLPVDAPLSLHLLALLLASPFGAPRCAAAASVNVTIDDTFGDESNGNQIVYLPPTMWNAGQSCSACTAHPDPKLAGNGTWHDSTFYGVDTTTPSSEVASAAVTFEGTAVYVFCIVTRSAVSPDGNSDMSFFLDGLLAGKFVQPPNGDAGFQYNVPVYVNESLPAGQHSIAIVNGELNGNKSLILLDYIVYTREENSTSDSSSSASSSSFPASSVQSSGSASASIEPTSLPVTATTGSTNSSQKRTIIIAVASVGGVLGLAVVIVIVSYCCIRKRSHKYNAPSEGGVIPRSPSHIEVDPATSGWAEGTWAGGDEDPPHSSLSPPPGVRRAIVLPLGNQRKMSGKRKRGGSDSQTAMSFPGGAATLAAPTKSSKSPTVPPALLHSIPTFRLSPSKAAAQSRADPPGSPASSSWGTPASMAPPDSATYLIASPTATASSGSHANLSRVFQLEPGDSSTTLSSHHAHPFAKAQAVDAHPLRRARSGTAPAPSAPGAGAAGTSMSTANHPPSAMPSSSSSYARARGYSAPKAPGAGDPTSSGTTSPTTPPSAQYTMNTLDTGESFLPSPSPADPSPLSLVPPRVPEKQPHQQQQLQLSPSQRRRRVDPVDPSLQASRSEGALRARRAEIVAQRQGQTLSEPRVRPTGTARERRRHGIVDVPVDAAESEPPSYRDGAGG
ncbi:hypothetical protein OH77DRAFT_1121930 [Trametes cingulata]|nr:hypothetical protein OH77DRAFT_1121930 [Trametes cingulata]